MALDTFTRPDRSLKPRLTAREVYLYGQLFPLVAEQMDAVARAQNGKLGLWGRARVGARQKRIGDVLQEISTSKSARGGYSFQSLKEEILGDLDWVSGNWSDVNQAAVQFVRQMVGISG